jgi:hypothetical protein
MLDAKRAACGRQNGFEIPWRIWKRLKTLAYLHTYASMLIKFRGGRSMIRRKAAYKLHKT